MMSNFGFHKAMRERHIEVAVAPVGDRYVLELMKERGAILGGRTLAGERRLGLDQDDRDGRAQFMRGIRGEP